MAGGSLNRSSKTNLRSARPPAEEPMNDRSGDRFRHYRRGLLPAPEPPCQHVGVAGRGSLASCREGAPSCTKLQVRMTRVATTSTSAPCCSTPSICAAFPGATEVLEAAIARVPAVNAIAMDLYDLAAEAIVNRRMGLVPICASTCCVRLIQRDQHSTPNHTRAPADLVDQLHQPRRVRGLQGVEVDLLHHPGSARRPPRTSG